MSAVHPTHPTTVVFSHGQESGPWGTKIQALAQVARDLGLEVESVDYQGIQDPDARVEKLLASPSARGGQLLVGSSMGGFVSVASASLLHARGVFLMAPALYMQGLPELRAGSVDCPATVVHGWRDDVVPFEHSMRFAKEYHASLHLLDGDHRLHSQVRAIRYLFEYFLIGLDLPPEAFE
jgi:fermentation-respiration switch protein FrsA (DUF1100 family)